MAYIIEFKIEGLAGRLRPFSAVLNRDVNVFFGLNGSGKTTLLKILYSALSTDTEILKDLPFKHAEVKIFLNRHRSSFLRSYTQPEATVPHDLTISSSGHTQALTLEKAGESLSKALLNSERKSSWSSDPPEPGRSSLTIHRQGFLPISRLYRSLTTSAGARRLSEKELDSAFARGLQAQWTEYYADISSAIARAQESGFANILGFFLSGQVDSTESIDAPDAEEAYTRIKGFLDRQPTFQHFMRSKREFSKLYVERPELRSVVKQIEKVENQISTINAPRQRFQRVLESLFTGHKHFIFGEKEIRVELPDERQIGLSFLSSGEKQLLFIAFQALVGMNHSLIIDEPELSMHIDWQKMLVSILRDLNPKIQQIMATHSPEIMAELSDDRIFRL